MMNFYGGPLQWGQKTNRKWKMLFKSNKQDRINLNRMHCPKSIYCNKIENIQILYEGFRAECCFALYKGDAKAWKLKSSNNHTFGLNCCVHLVKLCALASSREFTLIFQSRLWEKLMHPAWRYQANFHLVLVKRSALMPGNHKPKVDFNWNLPLAILTMWLDWSLKHFL